MVNHHWHECAECEHQKRIGSEGVRTVSACPNCEEMQRFENLET